MKKIRFGIIGAGTQGTAYAGFLTGKQTHPDFPNPAPPLHAALGALCGRSEATRRRCAELFPDVPFFADYREMIASGMVDAVVVAVPNSQHTKIAGWCLAHGMPVLLEKPAGIRADSVLELHRIADEHPDTAYGVMYNCRANSLFQRLHELIGSGALGQLRSTSWTITNFYRPDSYFELSPVRGRWSGEGGGVLTNQATHQLDLWQWLCGVPDRVYARMRFGAYREKMQVENEAVLLTHYANGAVGSFTASTCNLDGEDRLNIDLDGGRILVEDGRRAVIHRFVRPEGQVNAETGPEALRRLTSGKGLGVPLWTEEVWEANEPWGVQHVTMLENFALHLLEGVPLIVPGREALHTVELTNAALLSAWEHREVECPPAQGAFAAALEKKIETEKL